LSFSRENPSFEHNKPKHIIPFSEKKKLHCLQVAEPPQGCGGKKTL
jgi:hypothetical protein